MKTLALILLLSGQSADFGSSVGQYESNPLLRSPSGRFSIQRGLAIKAPITGGLILLQYKGPRLFRRPITYANIAVGSVLLDQTRRNLSARLQHPPVSVVR